MVGSIEKALKQELELAQIDEAFKDCGIDMQRLKELQEGVKTHKSGRNHILREIYELSWPAYVRLREEGYIPPHQKL